MSTASAMPIWRRSPTQKWCRSRWLARSGCRTNRVARLLRHCCASSDQRRLLLVFDNCEHLLEASAAIGQRSACRLLAGGDSGDESRTPHGRWRGELAGASLSLADEAVELFSDRARRARPTSRSPDTTPKRSPRSAVVSTACRWPSNWPPPGCGHCHSTKSSAACMTGSACSPAVLAPRCAASRRCAPRSTGRTHC